MSRKKKTAPPAEPREFKLMKEDSHWWSLADYAQVFDVMRALRPKRVLEFGPGPSTLSLIEGGAESIDTCEDVEDWAAVWDERLVQRFPSVVSLHRYTWPDSAPLSIPGIDSLRWDLALIDGPHGTGRRPDVLRYAMARCPWVLMPAEEWNTKPVLRPLITAIAKEAGRSVDFTMTGPLSGAFALVGPA